MEKENFLDRFVFICGFGAPDLYAKIVAWIGENLNSNIAPLHLNFDSFADQETNFQIVDNQKIKGKIAVIIESVYAEDSELETNLFQLIWSVKYEYEAAGIIMVMPFMKYRRQDHPEKKKEIHRNRYFIHQLKSNGVNTLLLCDIHSQQTLDNCAAENLPVEVVWSDQAFADQLQPQVEIAKNNGRQFFLYCPDQGSLERNITLARLLGVAILITLKRRLPNGDLEIYRDDETLKALGAKHGTTILWPETELINGATICLSDDEVSTGRTATKTGRDLIHQGAREIILKATHPVCTPGWKEEIIGSDIFSMILFGNTLPRGTKKRTGKRVTDVSLHWLIASKLIGLMASFQEKTV